MGHDCTLVMAAITTEWGGNWLVVRLKRVSTKQDYHRKNMIASIAIYGPRAILWDAACS